MLRLIEGFDSYSSTNAMQPGWSTTTAGLKLVAGRINGQALEMTSGAPGLYFTSHVFNSIFTKGTLGIAINLGDIKNQISLAFFNGSHEQFRIIFAGNGSISGFGLGREIARTGVNNFAGTVWNYFETSFSDAGLRVVMAGRPLVQVPRFSSSFDRVVFAIEDNQSIGVKIDDLYFDDEILVHGDTVVFYGSLPYVPAAIYGILSDGVKSTNPDGVAWSFREVSTMQNVSVLASRARVSSLHHSIIAQ